MRAVDESEISKYLAALDVEAVRRKFDGRDVVALKEYASRLLNQKLPVIFDDHHLSKLSGLNTRFLYSASNAQENFYRRFRIPKRRGGMRAIAEPLPDLKSFQSWFLEAIGGAVSVSRFSHAYRKSHSIKTNAKFHINRNVIINIDVSSFFSNIKTAWVFKWLCKLGYTRPVAGLIANLLTLDGGLPQGAPSSPSISNSILYALDEDLGTWALENGWRYTRYSDDLTLSGDGDVSSAIGNVYGRLRAFGLEPNLSKTRVMRRGARQIACGVVVNKNLGVPRSYRRKLRQEIYYAKKYGLSGHMANLEIDRKHYLMVLMGRAKYLLWMAESNPERKPEAETYIRDIEFLRRSIGEY